MSDGKGDGLEQKASLARVLGLGDVIGIVVGSVIGSGIFIVPATIAGEVSSPLLMLGVWLLGGVLSFFGGLCFAELGGMFPQAGGMYAYLREGYGALPSFLFGWTLFLVIDTGAVATLASAFATKYLPYFVALSPVGQKLVAVAFIAFLVSVNVLGVRHGANLQNALTLIKLVAIVAVSVLVFSFGKGTPDNLTTPAAPPMSLGLLGHFGVALIACLWAYKGWESATFSTGEIRNPQRTLYRGLVISNLMVLVLYIVTNVAYLWVIPANEMAGSDRIAADALARSIGPIGTSLISFLILFSILGAANANVLTSPRVYYAMASDGLFFRAVQNVHPRFRTPHVAVIAMGIWSVVLALSGSFEQLLGYVIFGQWLFFGLTAGAVLILRRRRPDLARPTPVWGYPVTPLLFIVAAVFIAVTSLATQPRNALAGLAIIALGVPVFAFWHRQRRRVTAPGNE